MCFRCCYKIINVLEKKLYFLFIIRIYVYSETLLKISFTLVDS